MESPIAKKASPDVRGDAPSEVGRERSTSTTKRQPLTKCGMKLLIRALT